MHVGVRSNRGNSVELVLPTIEDYNQYLAALPPLQEIRVRDGRKLTFRDIGPRDGVAVISLHGNPGSGAGSIPREETLQAANVRYIALNRAGSSDSDRNKGLYISDTTNDIEDLANCLGVGEFGVVAGSGGVPHGLGCAALLPERVIALAAMAGPKPLDTFSGWATGMDPANQEAYGTALGDEETHTAEIEEIAQAVSNDPFALIKRLVPRMTPTDLSVIEDKEICCSVAASHAEGLGVHGYGWQDDMRALLKPWGRHQELRLSDITAPTVLWVGEEDPFVPPEHSYWLWEQIPGAALDIEPGKSHFTRQLHFNGALQYIVHWANQP